MYQIKFYSIPGKTSPITDFLDTCSPVLKAKIIRQLKYLEEFGLNRVIPNLRKVSNAILWELRILGKDNIRIFCIQSSNQNITIIHIFKKKKQKTPLKDLNLAINRTRVILDK